MSSMSCFNQGVKARLTPPGESMNAYFAGFQCMALASGLVAAPTSPIPPDRESGPIIRNGAAVMMELIRFPSDWVPPPISCALTYREQAVKIAAVVNFVHILPACRLSLDITTKSTKIFYTFVRLVLCVNK